MLFSVNKKFLILALTFTVFCVRPTVAWIFSDGFEDVICDGSDLSLTIRCQEYYADYSCDGIKRCMAYGWGPCEMPEESCDDLDNNCNGVIDEGIWAADNEPQFTEAACNAEGVCGVTGYAAATCNLGIDPGWTCSYTHPEFQEGIETLCDDLDNDCDGLIDEDEVCGCAPGEVDCNGTCMVLNPTPACGFPDYTTMSSVSGDTNADTSSASGNGGRLLRIHVVENDVSMLGPRDLGVRVNLNVPGGNNYDLSVWCDGCGTDSYRLSSNGGSLEEEVFVWWGEESWIDSSRYLWIRVENIEVTNCAEWNLTVHGNVISGDATCSPL